MRKETFDPNCFIVEQEEGRIVYETSDGERWEITGICNMCGECEVGSNNEYLVWTGTPIGEPNACYDTRGGNTERLDYPVRPECSQNWPNCSLSGEYL